MTIQEQISQEWLAEEPNILKIKKLEHKLRMDEGSKEIASATGLYQEIEDLQAIQELDLTRELKRTRDQNSLIGLKDITEIMKNVFDSAELEWLRKNI